MSYREEEQASSEVELRADFSQIRYAQVWEDADVLIEGLSVRPGDICLSIASAGDNALALVAQRPSRVVALDLNPSQLACLELRVAAYRTLTHPELLVLIGDGNEESPGHRGALYHRCRRWLSEDVRRFWDNRPELIDAGIGSAGRFERYFALFRRWVLPLIHRRRTVQRLLEGAASEEERIAFYETEWNNTRWRLLFRIFFGRFVMGRLGRDPAFFQYVQGSVADRILMRTRHALTALNPADNPYLQWILTGRHTAALPYALRPENFEAIRANLDALEWSRRSVEAFLDNARPESVDRFNLSDIFEYMSPESYEALLRRLAWAGRIGGRLAYWNMLAPRRRPESMAHRLRSLTEEAERLHQRDKAFFYSAFVLEELR